MDKTGNIVRNNFIYSILVCLMMSPKFDDVIFLFICAQFILNFILLFIKTTRKGALISIGVSILTYMAGCFIYISYGLVFFYFT